MLNEKCYECGKSVALGNGKFVNRIPSLDDIKTRKKMNVLHSEGDFLCSECDEMAQKGNEEYFD